MPGIERQIGLLCPPKEGTEAEALEVDTQENNQDGVDGMLKTTSALGGANASPMAQLTVDKNIEIGVVALEEPQH